MICGVDAGDVRRQTRRDERGRKERTYDEEPLVGEKRPNIPMRTTFTLRYLLVTLYHPPTMHKHDRPQLAAPIPRRKVHIIRMPLQRPVPMLRRLEELPGVDLRGEEGKVEVECRVCVVLDRGPKGTELGDRHGKEGLCGVYEPLEWDGETRNGDMRWEVNSDEWRISQAD
jgi:hypothetical protein